MSYCGHTRPLDRERMGVCHSMAEAVSVRVLIADDHLRFRKAVRDFLDLQDDVEVVGEAENGRHATELADELAPDVVLMDVRMPEMDGVEATRIILSRHPATKVIALSLHDDDAHRAAMRQAGAAAYVVKDQTGQALLPAIRSLANAGVDL
ncbi:MAG: hypothetical protein COY42_21125 [Armatimonadetes bacterium CG_4_10_14_0_8_um_filter_66_14]|nr:MAG: hypothetical protein COY42_21125 [Armatimonadetes bacterium CG_4_10_14_0_8_um_filter_66_14]